MRKPKLQEEPLAQTRGPAEAAVHNQYKTLNTLQKDCPATVCLHCMGGPEYRPLSIVNPQNLGKILTKWCSTPLLSLQWVAGQWSSVVGRCTSAMTVI